MVVNWNYRVIIKDGIYKIHECYYDEKGCPKSISTDEMIPAGESFDDLRFTYNLMKEALDKPALMFDDF